MSVILSMEGKVLSGEYDRFHRKDAAMMVNALVSAMYFTGFLRNAREDADKTAVAPEG